MFESHLFPNSSRPIVMVRQQMTGLAIFLANDALSILTMRRPVTTIPSIVLQDSNQTYKKTNNNKIVIRCLENSL